MPLLKILIIDDNPDDAALAARVLGAADVAFETRLVSSAADFAEVLTHARFDAVLIEAKVHWSDGLELIAAIKKRAPSRPVVLFTAAADAHFLSSALEHGIDGFVVKGSRGFATLPDAIRAAQARVTRATDLTSVSVHRLLDRSGTAFFQCTLEGHFVEGNAAFGTLLGLAPAEAMDVNVLERVLPHDRHESVLTRLRQQGTVQLADVPIGPRGICCTLTATLTTDGDEPLVTGLLEAAGAPTEEPAPAPSSTTSRSALLGEKALGAAHDLKEPLRTIEHCSDALRTRCRGKLNADEEELLTYLHDAAKRMKAQITQLFQEPADAPRVAVPAANAPAAATLAANASIAFDRAMANLRASVVASGAQVTHGPMPTLPIADDELLQLLQNLIGNAIKFRADAPPRVHVSIVQTGGDWLISVEDNGLGVAPEDAARLFTMFGRGRAAEGKPGSGIGLALCKNIVERHGGRIWTAPSSGQGATFFFTLPTLAARAATARPAVGAPLSRPIH